MLYSLSSGIISYLRSGSFRAGFFSGLASAFDVGTKGYGTIVGRTSIMAIIGGTFAKLGGGKFANGALSAAFVHLFNGEVGKYIHKAVNSVKQLWKKVHNYIVAGVGGGIHLGVVGAFGQYNGTTDTLTVCARIGPGLYIGGGAQLGVQYDSNPDNNVNWSVGVGADYAFGTEGAGGQITANTDTVTISGDARLPNSSLGIGASGGVDLCYSFNKKR